jgi:hypothetical protein
MTKRKIVQQSALLGSSYEPHKVGKYSPSGRRTELGKLWRHLHEDEQAAEKKSSHEVDLHASQGKKTQHKAPPLSHCNECSL